MGDSRSWAADIEDTIVTCRHGRQHKYFDDCTCSGCSNDYNSHLRLLAQVEKIRGIALDFFSKIPESQWGSVVSLRIKKEEEDLWQISS